MLLFDYYSSIKLNKIIAWDRWPDDPLQCNSRAQQLTSYRLPLQQWLQSRTEAAYYVVGDVQIARIVFTIGAVVAFCYLILLIIFGFP